MDQIWACELEHLRAYCDRVLTASEESQNAAIAFFSTQAPEEKQILSVDGDVASLDIRGTLTNQRSLIGRLLGYETTAYTDIQAALETIQADDTIKTIRLVIDSPGGNLSGLDETWMLLRELAQGRAVIAENHGLMASAAYWLASAADKIIATSPSVETGSIGVYLSILDFSKADEQRGIKEFEIVSKNAPLKNPDPATKEGLKTLQERLNAIERVFISRVAEGRGVSTKTVESDFGQGNLLIAQDPDPSQPSALSVGMIDGVSGIAISAGRGTKNRKAENVDEDVLLGSPPFKDYPIIDKPWDSAAAANRWRSKSNSTEKPSADYKNGFFWYDPENTENFGAYKLPFVDVVEGRTAAIRRGVFAAKGAMAGARGNRPQIPPADVAGVNSHIDKYVKKIEKEDKEKQGSAAAAFSRKDQKMEKFAELLAANPDLQAEIEAKIAAAREEGKAGAKIPDFALKILTGDGPKYLKDLAVKVIQGEATEAELKGAQGAFDAMQEEIKAKAAAAETAAQGATPPEAPAGRSQDGQIRTEDDYQEAVAKLRRAKGLEAN